MQLRDIMTRNVKVISQTASVVEAARLMKDLDIGAIPVTSGDHQMVGMVTDRDIVLRSTAEGHNPADEQVSKVMTGEFFFCYEDENVEEAARLMSEKQIRRLPILNHENELVGIVSLGDISVDMGNDIISGKTLEAISKPARPEL